HHPLQHGPRVQHELLVADRLETRVTPPAPRALDVLAPALRTAGDRLPGLERHELAIHDLMPRVRPERTGDVAAVAQHVNKARFREATEDFADAADDSRRLLGPP